MEYKEFIDLIAKVYPEAITETVKELNNGNKQIVKGIKEEFFEELKDNIDIADDKNRFELNWPGKKRAKLLHKIPTFKALKPLSEENKKFNDEHSQNIVIEGDNLEALKKIKETYKGQIKMIYIDPPYNTVSDEFVYSDDFSTTQKDYLKTLGILNENNEKVIDEGKEDLSGRFHAGWLTFMYPRLKLAKELLHREGVIFISIGDEEVHNLKLICDEIFYEANHIGTVIRRTKTTSYRGNYFSPRKDYILAYGKDVNNVKKFRDIVDPTKYTKVEEGGPRKGEKYKDDTAFYLSTLETRPNQRYWIECPDGEKVIPPGTTFPPEKPIDGDGVWRWEESVFNSKKDYIVYKPSKRSPLINQDGEKAKWNIYTKSYLKDKIDDANIPIDIFDEHLDVEAKEELKELGLLLGLNEEISVLKFLAKTLEMDKDAIDILDNFITRHGKEDLKKLGMIFDFPKPVNLIKYLMKIISLDKDAIVLDFFAGSGTTGHAVMDLNLDDDGNRKFILIQIPEEVNPEKGTNSKKIYQSLIEMGKQPFITELTKERLRRAANYLLNKNKSEKSKSNADLGFKVFQLVDSVLEKKDMDIQEIEQLNIDDFRTDLTKENVEIALYEVLLKIGCTLDKKVNKKEIEQYVYYIVDGKLILVQKGLTKEIMQQIIENEEVLSVFLLSDAVSDSDSYINIEGVLQKFNINITLEVI